jgi:threonine aldolase
VLAAAGLVGLDRIGDLAVDHENAATLADGLAELGWQVSKPETNIVLATVPDLSDTLRRLTEIGVLATSTVGQVRLVTHRDVSSADITEALYRIKTSA